MCVCVCVWLVEVVGKPEAKFALDSIGANNIDKCQYLIVRISTVNLTQELSISLTAVVLLTSYSISVFTSGTHKTPWVWVRVVMNNKLWEWGSNNYFTWKGVYWLKGSVSKCAYVHSGSIDKGRTAQHWVEIKSKCTCSYRIRYLMMQDGQVFGPGSKAKISYIYNDNELLSFQLLMILKLELRKLKKQPSSFKL